MLKSEARRLDCENIHTIQTAINKLLRKLVALDRSFISKCGILMNFELRETVHRASSALVGYLNSTNNQNNSNNTESFSSQTFKIQAENFLLSIIRHRSQTDKIQKAQEIDTQEKVSTLRIDYSR
jgi:hypothetical protein